MKLRSKYLLVIAGILLSLVSFAIPGRPAPQRLVNDYADIFSPGQEAELEQTLVAFDDTTSNQITVVTVKDLEGYTAAEYATRIGLDWQVGSEKFDNGIVLLVKPKTEDSYGEVFIAVGYGLEGAIPDAYAKRIIDNQLIPHFSNGDYYGGVHSACEVLMKLASGEISDPREMEEEVDALSIILFLAFIGLIFFFVILFSKDDGSSGSSGGSGGSGGRRIVYTGPIITSGRRNGGFGGFGGSSSGGFGGFGGGSFGGGGAGGRW